MILTLLLLSATTEAQPCYFGVPLWAVWIRILQSDLRSTLSVRDKYFSDEYLYNSKISAQIISLQD